MCWFSSSRAAEVCEDALKSDKFIGHETSVFKSISECDETSSPKRACLPINYPNKKSVSIHGEMNSYTSHIDDPASLGQLSFVNGSDTKTEHRDDLMPKEQVLSVISNDCIYIYIYSVLIYSLFWAKF